jgi:hypothetical protein
MQRYSNQKQILLWDRVEYANAPATVVYVAKSKLENPRFPHNQWKSQIGNGILIEFDNRALLQLDECPKDEDLRFVSRKKN